VFRRGDRLMYDALRGTRYPSWSRLTLTIMNTTV